MTKLTKDLRKELLLPHEERTKLDLTCRNGHAGRTVWAKVGGNLRRTCLDCKSAAKKRHAAKAYKKRPVGFANRHYIFPVAPFKQLLLDHMAELEQSTHLEMYKMEYNDYNYTGLMTPQDQVSFRLSEALRIQHAGGARKVYDILHDMYEGITLRVADALVCVTVGPMWWYTGAPDEIKALYNTIGEEA